MWGTPHAFMNGPFKDLQLQYHVVELRRFTGDGGTAELSLGLGKPEPGPVRPERRKAHRRPVYVSSLWAVWSLLHDHVGVTNVGYHRVFEERLQHSNS